MDTPAIDLEKVKEKWGEKAANFAERMIEGPVTPAMVEEVWEYGEDRPQWMAPIGGIDLESITTGEIFEWTRTTLAIPDLIEALSGEGEK